MSHIQKTSPHYALKLLRTSLTLASFSLLIACGGGGGGGGGSSSAPPPAPPLSPPVSSAPTSYAHGSISGFGSIIVNGVRYDDSRATVKDSEDSLVKNSDLKLGMIVDVLADQVQTSSRGIKTAIASQINYRSELEGPVSSMNGNQLSILGQTVVINAATVFEEDRAATLQVGKVLEVYGLRDANGHLLASRIEIENDLDDPFKLQGTISSLNAASGTFKLGHAELDYRQIQNSLAPLANGEIVRVRLARTPNASGQWPVTSLKKATPVSTLAPIGPGSTGVRTDLEGYITAMESATRFVVHGIVVDASQVRKMPAGLGVGSLIEVEGLLSQGILQADEVELEQRISQDSGLEIEGIITRLNPDNKTFEVRGVTVDYSNSRFEDGTVNQLAVGVEVEIKGSLASDGVTIKATLIEFD